MFFLKNVHLKGFVSTFQVLQKFSLFVHGLNHLWGEHIVCLIQNRMGPDLRKKCRIFICIEELELKLEVKKHIFQVY